MKPQSKLIVFTFTILSLLSPIGAIALEREGHAGSPEEVEADPFPNPGALKEALGVMGAKVAASALPLELKEKITSESAELLRDQKFYSLPAIVLRILRQSKDSSTGQSKARYIDLGGYTDSEPGAPVYLSRRVAKYGVDQLAPIVSHEILHHVVSRALANDEDFLDALNAAIFDGVIPPAVSFALRTGLYLQPGQISADQFLDFFHVTQAAAFYGSRVKNPDDLKAALRGKLLHNIAEMPVAQFTDSLVWAAVGEKWWGKIVPEYLIPEAAKLVLKTAKDLNPENPYVNELSPRYHFNNFDSLWYWSCKKWTGGFLLGKCVDYVRMKDLFTLPANPQN
jgi:hypothetical protein